jgi:hypothetical protein
VSDGSGSRREIRAFDETPGAVVEATHWEEGGEEAIMSQES